MIFSTIDFVIFFIVVLSTIVIIKNRKFQHLFLVAASYFFFYYTSNYLIILLIFTTLWDFYFGNIIYKTKNSRIKKLIFITSLAGNLGLLGFFKYADFAIAQFNVLGQHFNLNNIPLFNFVLPIGISFYTFHSITYTVGIYRGTIQPVRLREYALFVAFFPQLVAGPILRAHEFLPQLREKIDNSEIGYRIRQIVIHNANLKFGITMMAFGFLKKMFFANNIAPLVNEIFIAPQGLESFTIILGTIAFGIQIYCDFSGYSDIAIGAALILGFKLPINFNKPYFARSPSDFWRRWHISLSTWLRDYLYIPLGGNKKSKFRTYFNLIIVMFLGGLWHGASWNFVIWGLLHGIYLSAHKAISNRFPQLSTGFFGTKIGRILSILITQYLVFLTWIAFRVKDTNDMIYSMSKYVMLDLQITDTVKFVASHKLPIIIMGIFIVLHFVSYKKTNLHEQISNFKSLYWIAFLTGCMILVFFFFDGNPEKFLYFQF